MSELNFGFMVVVLSFVMPIGKANASTKYQILCADKTEMSFTLRPNGSSPNGTLPITTTNVWAMSSNFYGKLSYVGPDTRAGQPVLRFSHKTDYDYLNPHVEATFDIPMSQGEVIFQQLKASAPICQVTFDGIVQIPHAGWGENSVGRLVHDCEINSLD